MKRTFPQLVVALAVLIGCGGRSVVPGEDGGETVKQPPPKDQAVPIKPPSPDLQRPPSEAREPVTCVFTGSAEPQLCYTATSSGSPLDFSCKGAPSCTVEVRAAPGTKLTWKSSCGGYAYTTVDGVAEQVIFPCAHQQDVELVTCVFKGSSAVQECYSADQNNFGCKGTTSCTVKVNATTGTSITWKSSCGGYAYTTVDGVDENAEFFCAP